jgi:hypothetical protein
MEIRNDLVAKALLQEPYKIYTTAPGGNRTKIVYFLQENNELTYAFYYYPDGNKYIPMSVSELMMLKEVVMTTTTMSVHGKTINLKKEYYEHI